MRTLNLRPEPFASYSELDAYEEVDSEGHDAGLEYDLDELEGEAGTRRRMRPAGLTRYGRALATGGRRRPPPRRPRPHGRIRQWPAGPGVCSCPEPTCPTHGTEYIRWLQSALNDIRNLRLPVTGTLGPEHRSALRAFQGEQGLPADGIAGPETKEALLRARSSKTTPPQDATDQTAAMQATDSEWEGEESLESFWDTVGSWWQDRTAAWPSAGLRPKSTGGGRAFGTLTSTLTPVPGMERTTDPFRRKVIQIAQGLGTDPNFLMAIMSFESGFDPSIRNPDSGATGLIQFTASTAKQLGTSTDALARMTAEQQLDYVARYFAPYKGRLKTLEDAYMAVLWPKAIGQGSNYVLFASPSTAYQQNQALDVNRDGKITVAEAISFVRKRLGSAAPAPGSPSSPPSGRTGPSTRPVLRRGSKGSAVTELQNRLAALGFSPGAADGIFGSLTEEAVKSFQRSRAIAVDGIVGPKTWGQLYAQPATGGGAPSPTPGPSAGEPQVTIGSNALVSDNAVRVLKDILRAAGLTRATITSGRRTANDQARVMYDNLERYGISHQKKLYGSSGDKVIDVYSAAKAAGRSATEIKRAMEDKIKALGPQNVSHHCSETHDVIDVGPSSIADQVAFRHALDAALKSGTIDKYIPPPDDPAFHIEIILDPTANEVMSRILRSPPLPLDVFLPRSARFEMD